MVLASRWNIYNIRVYITGFNADKALIIIVSQVRHFCTDIDPGIPNDGCFIVGCGNYDLAIKRTVVND